MKLVEAIKDMKQGDVFKPTNPAFCGVIKINNIGTLLDKYKQHIPFSTGNMNMEGEIIRAEPEVLTAEQIIRKNNDKIYTRCELVELGIETGQIKEYKRLKPLIDAVKDVITHPVGKSKIRPDLTMMIDSNPIKWTKLEGALENLTPPWEPEK